MEGMETQQRGVSRENGGIETARIGGKEREIGESRRLDGDLTGME